MSAPDARVVRIVRKPSSREGTTVAKAPPEPVAATPRAASPRPTEPTGAPPTPTKLRRFVNAGGVHRSLRLYLWGFVAPPLALWAVLLVLIVESPYAAVRSSLTTILAITLLLAVAALGGYALTLARTPKAFRFDPGRRSLQVLQFAGGVDRFRLSPEAFQVAVEYHEADLFSREETELIEVHNRPYRNRRWVVERGLLDPILPRYPSVPRINVQVGEARWKEIERLEAELRAARARLRESAPGKALNGPSD